MYSTFEAAQRMSMAVSTFRANDWFGLVPAALPNSKLKLWDSDEVLQVASDLTGRPARRRTLPYLKLADELRRAREAQIASRACWGPQ